MTRTHRPPSEHTYSYANCRSIGISDIRADCSRQLLAPGNQGHRSIGKKRAAAITAATEPEKHLIMNHTSTNRIPPIMKGTSNPISVAFSFSAFHSSGCPWVKEKHNHADMHRTPSDMQKTQLRAFCIILWCSMDSDPFDGRTHLVGSVSSDEDDSWT